MTETTFDATWLQTINGRLESEFIEYKRQWYDFQSKRDKAEFVKDILALANSVMPDRDAYLLIGVKDKKAGGGLLGVTDPPSGEAISQILASYTNPVPTVEPHLIEVDGKHVSVLRVKWNDHHPHYATRDYPQVLSSQSVYIRRGDTVGTVSLAELEYMIRQKDGRVGAPIAHQPIEAGFVEEPSPSGAQTIIARVVNRSEARIEGVSTVFDVRLAKLPHLMERQRRLTDAKLEPGEARECELRLSDIAFYEKGKRVELDNFVWSRWFDITFYVKYRDRDGFIQQFSKNTVLSN